MPRAIRLEVDFGCRAPIMNAAIGRLMAVQGGYSRDEVAQLFADNAWASDLTVDRFIAEGEEAARRGWSIDRGDFNPRLLSVAAAAPPAGPTIDRGVTATMFVDQHTDATVDRIAYDLQEIARNLLHHS